MNGLESKIQTGIQIILVSVMLWIGNSTVEMKSDIAVIKLQLYQAAAAAAQVQAAALAASSAAAAVEVAAVRAATVVEAAALAAREAKRPH